MAKMRVFVVYDSKVEAYLQPFFAPTIGAALRMWETTVNSNDSQIAKYPADYTLFETAEFDEATGRFVQHDALKNLGTAIEQKRSASPEIRQISG